MDNITIHAEQVTLHLHAAGQPAELIQSSALELVHGEASAAAALASVAAATVTTPESRFIKVLADGSLATPGDARNDHVAVIDRDTKLMWSVESLGDPDDADDGITQEHCIERCRELRLLGFDNWRLPTRAELVSLIDDTHHEPAIDTSIFPRIKPQWHWTSTLAAWSSASAWLVDFDLGLVNGGRRDYDGFALAVRRVGQ